jgi:hypothetical protein
VKEIVGNCERFDYQTTGKDVPPVDLPDLRPFLEAMLIQNRRRPRRGDDGSLSFKTPEAWLSEIGVRASYEGLVFDRGIRGKDAVARVLGVGHKIIEQALHQALDETACVAIVSNAALRLPLIVMRVSDQVTGREAPIRNIVLAAEKHQDTGEWLVLRDWEAVRRLNEVASKVNVLRIVCTPLDDSTEIRNALTVATDAMAKHVSRLNTGFRVPVVQALAVIWPGIETVAPTNRDVKPLSIGADDLLE